MDLPYPVLLLLKATFHNYFLHPSWTSSRWVCLCVNEYWCFSVKCSYEKKKFHGKRSGKWPGRVFLPLPFSLSGMSWWPVPGLPRFRSPSVLSLPEPSGPLEPKQGTCPQGVLSQAKASPAYQDFTSEVACPASWWASRWEEALPDCVRCRTHALKDAVIPRQRGVRGRALHQQSGDEPMACHLPSAPGLD